MISFCTWIYNRFHQFEKVFFKTLVRMRPQDEWIILDVCSTDGMRTWEPPLVAKGPRIRLLRQQHAIHFAKLYNVAHSYATMPVQVTLDADNFIGPRFCKWAESIVARGRIGHAWTGDWMGGTCGRIVFPADHFPRIKYDESFEPAGAQDLDLLRQYKAAGVQCVETRDPLVVGGAIPNSAQEKQLYLGVEWAECNRKNAAKMRKKFPHLRKR